MISFFVPQHIPVHTLHIKSTLDPKNDPEDELNRAAPLRELIKLARQSGGMYEYITNVNNLTDNKYFNLHQLLIGFWRLRVSSDLNSQLFDQQLGIKLATGLQVTIQDDVTVYEAQGASDEYTPDQCLPLWSSY